MAKQKQFKTRTGKKRYVPQNVYELAKERTRQVFERFDEVMVAFSAGKDSTAVLNVALEVAHEYGRTPLKVVHWDEEVTAPDTHDYVLRVANRPDVEMLWACVPLKHPNACSRREPWWYQWDEADRHRWVRDMPEGALTYRDLGITLRQARETSIFTCSGIICPDMSKMYCILLGIRAEESIHRYRTVTVNKGIDNHITHASIPRWTSLKGEAYDAKGTSVSFRPNPHVYQARPVYDWTWGDCWKAVHEFDWDWNRAYGKMTKLGVPARAQRVVVPFHQLTYHSTWYFPKIWPEFWERALDRVEGARTAVRYNHTTMYHGVGKPKDGYTWQDIIRYYLNRWPEQERGFLARHIQSMIEMHYRYTDFPIPEDEPGTTVTWKNLARVAKEGEFEERMTWYRRNQAALHGVTTVGGKRGELFDDDNPA